MNMANWAVKSKVGKQNVDISTFNNGWGTVVHRMDTVYAVILENVFVAQQEC